MKFNGPCYDPKFDKDRLLKQSGRIYDLMQDGCYRTLAEIELVTRDPASSISAQLRHLKKPEFGSYQLEKRRRGLEKSGLWEYRILPPLEPVKARFNNHGQVDFMLPSID